MLEVRKLTIKKIAEKRTLIQDLSFDMNKGDKFAVIGLEGIGKSTLLKAIKGEDVSKYVEIEGEIRKLNTRIGYLPQNPREIWKNEIVIDFLIKDEIDSIIEPENYQLLGVLDRVLNYVNFDSNSFHDHKKINEFSGGEIIKLGIAKLLLREPDVLLLDEPTNDLDLETILFLEDFILKENRPILYISHDEALLENTANGVVHLTNIRGNTQAVSVFQKITYREYRSRRVSTMNQQEMVARKQRSDFKKKMARFTQIYQKVEHLQNQAVRNPTQGRLLKKKMKSLKSTEARYEKEKQDFLDIPEREEEINLFFENDIRLPNNKTVLDYENIDLVTQSKTLVKSLTFTVKGPEKIAIIGRNGIGKSTLIRKIYKDLQNSETIKVGYMSQNYSEILNDEDTVLNSVLDSQDKEKENRIRLMLGCLNFTGEEMMYQIKKLSGGQKAKLLLLKLVLEKPNVLLLDEPTRNLSPLSLPVISRMLIEYGGCIICVTHDRNFIELVFDKVCLLTENGMEKL